MRIFEFVPNGQEDCSVTAWLHTEGESGEMAKRNVPAVVICPGGGFGMVSAREAEPIAQMYFANGYNTFVLRYALGEKAKNFLPLCQLAATVAHIRDNAEEWLVDPNKIAVWGASAGGHLAASLGTLYNTPEFQAVFERHEYVRPNAMVLIYAVLTADRYMPYQTVRRVSGEEIGHPKYEWFGLNNHVDEHTPPTFLYHTADDTVVPARNSLKFAEALSECKIPYELHVLPHGPHGMSACTQAVGSLDDYNARWMQWSVTWLNRMFEFRG